MGFFSQDCVDCGHPALSIYAVNEINDWMQYVVVITPQGDIISGEYDGYGRVAGAEYAVYADNTVWHKACWQLAGSPLDFRGESRPSDDQGYFFEDEHDLPDPRLNARVTCAKCGDDAPAGTVPVKGKVWLCSPCNHEMDLALGT